MSIDRLDKTFDVLVENDIIDKEEISAVIKENLKFASRPYQLEAFARFNYYINEYKKRRKPTQLLFHMATGSGKTLIMAGTMLELYKLGYRNFIFFVNTDTIIRKTKENFLNPNSSKYLFKNPINIEGQHVEVREVDNFESINEDAINILFSKTASPSISNPLSLQGIIMNFSRCSSRIRALCNSVLLVPPRSISGLMVFPLYSASFNNS